MFTYQGEYWRGTWDNYSGDAATITFLEAQAAKFISAGFGGVAILARDGTSTLVGDQALEAAGVLYFQAEYANTNYTPSLNGGLAVPVDYEDLAIGVGIKRDGSPYESRYVVPNIATALKSHSAHPSAFTWSGSTPELFETMCRNVLTRMVPASPRILTIYNVSEWAEGGPSLQPNMRDGKRYLTALKNALSCVVSEQKTLINPYTRQANQLLSAPSVPIVPAEGAFTVPVRVTYAWTSTAAPIIQDPNPYDGKQIRIRLDQSSTHAGPMTLQDIGTRADSGLRLAAATIALSLNDSVQFEYDATQALWVQAGNVVNVL